MLKSKKTMHVYVGFQLSGLPRVGQKSGEEYFLHVKEFGQIDSFKQFCQNNLSENN